MHAFSCIFYHVERCTLNFDHTQTHNKFRHRTSFLEMAIYVHNPLLVKVVSYFQFLVPVLQSKPSSTLLLVRSGIYSPETVTTKSSENKQDLLFTFVCRTLGEKEGDTSFVVCFTYR